MKLHLAALILLTLAPLHAAEDLTPWNGVYSLCEELGRKTAETIELKDGRFRYWYWSSTPKEKIPRYPLSGWYTVQGHTLTLEHKEIDENVRTFDTLNGTKVLWRESGLRAWTGDGTLQPESVLLRAGDVPEKERDPSPPSLSIKTVKSPETLAREARRFAERYDKFPEPARTLFITTSERADPGREAYRAAIERLRSDPSPEVFKQLLSRLVRDNPDNRKITGFLEDLVPKDNGTALNLLADAITEIPESAGIASVLLLFMSRAGIESLTLEIPEGGVRIRLLKTQRSSRIEMRSLPVNPPQDDWYWTDRIQIITAACQKWCRDQLAIPRRLRAKNQ